MKKYAVIGLGAIGGYFAACMARANFELHCLAPNDYQKINQDGFLLHSNKKTERIFFKAYASIEDMPVCDVILVALKTTKNKFLHEHIAKILASNSLIVLLQNGIGMEQELAQYVAAEQIVGACFFASAKKIGPGEVQHILGNRLNIAAYLPEENNKLVDLASDFNQAGIQTKIVENLEKMRFEKLLDNVPFNGLSVLLNASIADLLSDPDSLEIIKKIQTELLGLARSRGIIFPSDFIEKRMINLQGNPEQALNFTSMKFDFDHKRKLELKAIYENPLKLAKEHGISMPLIEMLYEQLRFLTRKFN